MATPFGYAEGQLGVDGVTLADLASRYGTPLYVYHLPTVADRLSTVRAAFSRFPTQVCYSVKANSNLRLLKWFSEHDVGFDVVSGGELSRLEIAGIPGDRVVFAGVGKTSPELEHALRADLWMITIETLEELDLLATMAGEAGRSVAVALRINPDVDARTHPGISTGRRSDKFGLDSFEFATALDRLGAQDALRLVAIHMHLGSQITEVEPYRRGLEVLASRIRQAREVGLTPRWINAGGGFGVAYDGEPTPAPDAFADAILPIVEAIGGRLVLELGRYLVAESACLVTEVLSRKHREPHQLVIVDAGMTDLIRPALYGARHRIWPLQEPAATGAPTDVAGPICESTDILARGCPLPPARRGDRLAILDVGAYGMSMASQYNSHPRAAEVWIDDHGVVESIRRRETIDDVLAVEREALDGRTAG